MSLIEFALVCTCNSNMFLWGAPYLWPSQSDWSVTGWLEEQKHPDVNWNQPEHSCFKFSGTYFYEWWSRMSAASKCTFTSGTRFRNRSAGESFMALGVNLVAFFEVLYHSLFACQRLHVLWPGGQKTAKPCIAMFHLYAPDHDNTLLIYRVWVKQLLFSGLVPPLLMMVIHLVLFWCCFYVGHIETKCVLVGEIRPQTLNAAEEFKYPQILQDGPKDTDLT